jgi:hypothetical protein
MATTTARPVSQVASKSRQDLVSTIIVGAFGVFTLALGVWAMVDARSFFDNIGHFPPYNAHFVHDVGAFQIGIGVALLCALAWRDDAILVALGGAAAGATAHEIAHIVDSDRGGRDSDPFTLGIIAVILLAVFAWRLRERLRSPA